MSVGLFTNLTSNLGLQLYDPFRDRQCSATPAVEAGCLAASGSGDSQGDPIESSGNSPGEAEQIVLDAAQVPAGKYVLRVINFLAVAGTWTGQA